MQVVEDIFEIYAPEPELTRPFLKWPGGKLKMLEHIKKVLPKNGRRFIEPFVGTGSIALNVDYPRYLISDTNRDLICVYHLLRESKSEFIEECRKLFIPEDNDVTRYEELRNEFNSPDISALRKAVLFIYLNRHCFNGLCRYNQKGIFNAHFAYDATPYFPEQELNKAIKKIDRFDIRVADFREIFDEVREDDVVYCDPPYLPIHDVKSVLYTNEFGLQDHLDLAYHATVAKDHGATVIISNHYNWYSKEIYTKMYNAKIMTFDVAKTINRDGDGRKPVKEVLAIFGHQ